jgi:hypothetical protein
MHYNATNSSLKNTITGNTIFFFKSEPCETLKITFDKGRQFAIEQQHNVLTLLTASWSSFLPTQVFWAKWQVLAKWTVCKRKGCRLKQKTSVTLHDCDLLFHFLDWILMLMNDFHIRQSAASASETQFRHVNEHKQWI